MAATPVVTPARWMRAERHAAAGQARDMRPRDVAHWKTTHPDWEGQYWMGQTGPHGYREGPVNVRA